MIKINSFVCTFLAISLFLCSHELISGHNQKGAVAKEEFSFVPDSDDVHFLFKSKSRPIHSFDFHPTSQEIREELKEQFLMLLSKKYLSQEEELQCRQLKEYLKINKD